MSWKDFTRFDRMITPVIIRWVFAIGLVLIIIGGVFAFFGMIIAGAGTKEIGLIFAGIFLVPLGMALLLLLFRTGCESIILIFQMNESLTDIKNKLP